ncbi:LysR family transcriptional regulator [Actinoplanes sp. NPDC051513]|uniref:LysR family transcriptional regulator n=1 Tax=Actinoplanes sp. NPDC051513 TaxID=3363908 RepID=UPI0037B8B0E0
MEIRQLEYFVAVAEHGGFSRAAEHLHIVQSAVSQQVQRLEHELGVRLFDRSTRLVRLSGAGERLLPEARALLDAAGRISQVAAGVVAGEDGVLRLGTIHETGGRLYKALNKLAAAAPRVQVRLIEAAPAERIEAVRSGQLDAALVRGLATSPGVRFLPIWTSPLYVALPADHPVSSGSVVHREQLKELEQLPLRLAARQNNPPFYDLIEALCHTAGIKPPPGPPFTNLLTTLTAIGVGAPSWTIFYEVSTLPSVHRVAIRALDQPAITTSLAVPARRPVPALHHLLDALTGIA